LSLRLQLLLRSRRRCLPLVGSQRAYLLLVLVRQRKVFRGDGGGFHAQQHRDAANCVAVRGSCSVRRQLGDAHGGRGATEPRTRL
jgi:hypothetical protein